MTPTLLVFLILGITWFIVKAIIMCRRKSDCGHSCVMIEGHESNAKCLNCKTPLRKSLGGKWVERWW